MTTTCTININKLSRFFFDKPYNIVKDDNQNHIFNRNIYNRVCTKIYLSTKRSSYIKSSIKKKNGNKSLEIWHSPRSSYRSSSTSSSFLFDFPQPSMKTASSRLLSSRNCCSMSEPSSWKSGTSSSTWYPTLSTCDSPMLSIRNRFTDSIGTYS